MTNNDPFAQRPITRPVHNSKTERPALAPVSAALQSKNKGTRPENEGDPRQSRLQMVSIDRITASHFQHRDELNATEDREYQTLLAQVRGDLEKQKETPLRTIEHVFIVMPDPANEQRLILAKGGHRRYEVCLDLGVKEIYVWIKDYDETALATGTYQENKGRKKTNWIEDARTFKDMMESLDLTQAQVAQVLHVEGGQPHVSRCLAMLDYHPDLQRMVALGEERGMRAAKELARLESHFGTDKARELWTPLIAGFRTGELFTDDIESKVKHLLGEEPGKEKKPEVAEFPVIRRQRLAKSVHDKWKSFRREIGNEPLDDETRDAIETVYREIGEILRLS